MLRIKYRLLILIATLLSQVKGCLRIYGTIEFDPLTGDQWYADSFDNCVNTCSGNFYGYFSYETVASFNCNSGYSLTMTDNGASATYDNPWSGFTLPLGPTTRSYYTCGWGGSNGEIHITCEIINFGCWSFAYDCNGCGGYQPGQNICSNGVQNYNAIHGSNITNANSTIHRNNVTNSALSHNSTAHKNSSTLDVFLQKIRNENPNPVDYYDIVEDMVNNGTIKLSPETLINYRKKRALVKKAISKNKQ